MDSYQFQHGVKRETEPRKRCALRSTPSNNRATEPIHTPRPARRRDHFLPQPLAPQFMPNDQSPQSSNHKSELTTTASNNDEFIVVEENRYRSAPINSFLDHHTALAVNCDLVLRDAIKKHYPHLDMVVCIDHACDILSYAAIGKVDLKPNTSKDHDFLTQVVFFQPEHRSDGPGTVQPTLDFGCFDITTETGHKFIHYYARYVEDWQLRVGNYFLCDQHSKAAVQELILEACAWSVELHNEILVFQSSEWVKDHKLWQSVQKADWKDVILDEKMKKSVISDFESFFSSKQTYADLGVPWKRGLIFHGPPGNGKTISIKAMMKDLPHPSLYVKSFHTWAGDELGISMIFDKARAMAPCLLILEDIDSLVNMSNRSFFLNQVDGLDENDGILVLATTNYLERLDPGIVNRPSRFDRKYYFPMPSLEERKKYCQYWRKKLENNDRVDFPDSLVDHIALWTPDFSFAYLKEAFVSSLLIIAGNDKKDNAESFEVIIKRQIEILKKEMGDGSEMIQSMSGLEV